MFICGMGISVLFRKYTYSPEIDRDDGSSQQSNTIV